MENKEHIAKVYIMLEAIAQSKARYIEILDKDNEPVYKIKLTVDPEDMIDFLDGFFDEGFKVREISKEDFDSFEGLETLHFNL
jgi:sulfatase maturation enzyme AslB (radical SAM superfamily)